MPNYQQVDFRYGMVSEKLRRRSDLSIYQNSASLIENAVPVRTGGARQREGLLAVSDDVVGATRIVPLSVSASESYVIAFVPYSGGELSSPNGFVYSTSGVRVGDFFHSYDAESLSVLSYAQNYEMVVFADGRTMPRVLRWTKAPDGSIGFTLSIFSLKKTYTVYRDGAMDKEYAHPTQYTYEKFLEQGEYPAGVAFVANRLCFYNFTSIPYGIFMSKPFEYTDFQEHVLYSTMQSSLSKDLYVCAMELQDSTVSSKGTQTGKDGSTYTNSFKKTETTVSTAGYYITTVTIVDDKGNVKESFIRTKVWNFSKGSDGKWSKTETSEYRDSAVYFATDTEVFKEVITDDCAIRLELSSDRDETICWLGQNGEYVFMGTTSSEWIMPSGVTATAVQCSKLSSYGSREKAHCAYGMRNIFHIQAGGRKIRSLQYSAQGTAFTELSYPIPEMFGSGVKELLWQRVPEPRLYAVCGSSAEVLNVMCYDADYGVSAWCRWTFSAPIASMCVVDTEDGQRLFAVYRDRLCVFDEATYRDYGDTEAFIPKVATNNLESSSTLPNGKRNYAIMADTDGTPFSACSYSPATNKVTPFVCRKVNAQLSKVEAYTPYPSDQGLRVLIQGKGGEPFTLLALIIDMEVVQ